jgi:hypothetical protein
LLDTIAEAFSGDRELFKGLWIYDSDFEFQKHPVIRVDMSSVANESPDVLKAELSIVVKEYIEYEGLDIVHPTPSAMFRSLIRKLHEKYHQRVVVLIDEYDKPILDQMTKPEKAAGNREVIRDFYGILKSMDAHLRFVFVTGVSKFTKTSIFSGLNNLYDMTMAEKYASVCGIPVEQLGEYFHDHIAALSSHKHFTQFTDIKSKILEWYDGYSWDGVERVLNPWSLLNFFTDKKFNSYWYASGSPKFLIDMIKEKPEAFLSLKNLRISEGDMERFDIDSIAIEPLLFQTGYLSVKEVEYLYESPRYIVEMPNREVRDAFNLQILESFTGNSGAVTSTSYHQILDALHSGDLGQMLIVLRRLFASIPYELHVNKEAYYHSIFYAMMNLLGFDISAEVSTARGRIDAVLEKGDNVYVMEFKYIGGAGAMPEGEKETLFQKALDEGMEQIKGRSYHEKYVGGAKTVYLAVFAFLGRDEVEMRWEVAVR